MLDHFNRSAKPIFKDPNERSFIKFGSLRDKDPSVGIRNGQLYLEGLAQHLPRVSNRLLTSHCSSHEVAKFFEPSISAIVEAVRKQQAASPKIITVRLSL